MVKKTHRQQAKEETDDWMQKKWRPMMAMLYMGICAFDFIIAPVLWSVIQAVFHGGLATQWQPLTLQGGGLIHLSFGAVLGISAYGRSQEKINGVAGGGAGFGAGTTYIPPNQNVNTNMNNGFGNNTGFGNNQSNGFSSSNFNNNGFGNNTIISNPPVMPAPVAGPVRVVPGYNGKASPAPIPDTEL